MSTEHNKNPERDYSGRFEGQTRGQLIELFNREVGNTGWGSARAAYLSELHLALLNSGIDCSAVIPEPGTLSLKNRVKLEADRLVISKLPDLRKITDELKFRYWLLRAKTGTLPKRKTISITDSSNKN